jgi:hypothetical protein
MQSLGKKSAKRSLDGALITRGKNKEGFVIFSRALRPTDIDRKLTTARDGVQRLLRTAKDVVKSQAMPDSNSAKEMFRRTVFFGTEPTSYRE